MECDGWCLGIFEILVEKLPVPLKKNPDFFKPNPNFLEPRRHDGPSWVEFTRNK